MPDPDLPVVEKRRVLRRFGWQREAGVFLDDLPMVAVPQLVAKHMAMNAVKLLAALHYRHTGTCLNGAYGVVTAWSQQGLPGRHEARDTLIGGMPDLGVGSRVNTSIGDQFGYRWGRNEQASIFGMSCGPTKVSPSSSRPLNTSRRSRAFFVGRSATRVGSATLVGSRSTPISKSTDCSRGRRVLLKLVMRSTP
jgi:hypothetical protein